jgi:hypothetical protein
MRSAPLIGCSAILYVILTVTSAAPLAAHPGQAPLGVIIEAVQGNKITDITRSGSTIYAGDRLSTQNDEKLRARLGGSQLYMAPGTLVEMGGLPNDYSVILMSGTVVISSADHQTFQLLADGITIRPVGTQRSAALVIWKNSHELEVTSISGELQLSIGEQVETIQQGKAYNVEIKTENPEPRGPAGPSQGAVPTGKSHFTKYAIVGGSIATGIGTWRAFVSPCAP